MNKYFTSNDPAQCCGCRACEQVCGRKAISFSENGEGFLYPQIDSDKCVNCGLCEKVCPIANAEQNKLNEGATWAAQNQNLEDLKESSSGGGFIAIARYALSKGGVVYGAAYDEDHNVVHKRADSFEMLKPIMGSKYVQSDIADTYTQAKKDLQDGRFVYFTGTPCQIAGLKLFLRKDYANLLTSDVICHGTPSAKIFQNTISHIKKVEKGELMDYSFRDKRIHGWSCSSSSSWRKGNTKHYLKYSKDMEAYFKAFISGDLMRMSCYNCPFATTMRVGDITLADHWGIRKEHPDFKEIRHGVSLIIVNSEKGSEIWGELEKQFNVIPISIDEASRHNHNLHSATPLTPSREVSYNLAFNDYTGFVEKYYEGNYIKNRIKVEVEFFIRRHERLFRLISKLAHVNK